MIVVGGTYREQTIFPSHEDDLGGSGFRAAAAVREATLITAINDRCAMALEAGAAANRIVVDVVERDTDVAFQYFTPTSPPSLEGGTAMLLAPIEARGENILGFGMIESGHIDVAAERLVYDPQSTTDVRFGSDHLHARDVGLSANTAEVRAYAGREFSVEDAARRLAIENNLSFVVAKAGPRGCYVFDSVSGLAEWVPSFPTASVWKLGSGDVFSAALAHAWFNGADIVEAARIASRSAAHWCSTRQNSVPESILAGRWDDDLVALDAPDAKACVYLASPFFTLAESWLVEHCRTTLLGLGVEVFSPLHEVGLGGDEVAARDLEGLDRSTAILALLDHADAGTLFEVGWATHSSIPVVGFSWNVESSTSTMVVGTGGELHTDLTSALYRVAWVAQGAKPKAGRFTWD